MQPAGCFHSRSGVRLNHELALARSDEDANSSPRTAAWFPPALIYPKKRGVRYNVEFAKMLFSTSRKSSRNVSKSESRLVPSAELCLVISRASLPNFLPRPYRVGKARHTES